MKRLVTFEGVDLVISNEDGRVVAYPANTADRSLSRISDLDLGTYLMRWLIMEMLNKPEFNRRINGCC